MPTQFAVPKRNDVINEMSLIAGIGYERELRYEQTIDVTPWVKSGYNSIEIAKLALDDPTTYACGVYICKRVRPYELMAEIPKRENP